MAEPDTVIDESVVAVTEGPLVVTEAPVVVTEVPVVTEAPVTDEPFMVTEVPIVVTRDPAGAVAETVPAEAFPPYAVMVPAIRTIISVKQTSFFILYAAFPIDIFYFIHLHVTIIFTTV
jgi:hypothetical protein